MPQNFNSTFYLQLKKQISVFMFGGLSTSNSVCPVIKLTHPLREKKKAFQNFLLQAIVILSELENHIQVVNRYH